MTVGVFRCNACGREVLVRQMGPMSETEIARRVREEFEPTTPGLQGRADFNSRLRDDIWVGVSSGRDSVPRDELPAACPACSKKDWRTMRVLD
jgi:hypothetical protein